MTLYELSRSELVLLEETTFSNESLRERDDLQRLLRERVEVVAPGTLVLSEEFENWEESRRRIDLLGLDKKARLVVIELKRTEDVRTHGAPGHPLRGHGLDDDLHTGGGSTPALAEEP